ncbi:MAG: hypothetical protein QOI40_2117 [Alphaproteobacteria bacterium]|jgi:transcriptional regulator with XRE-family HTH domain|nr:hypothetical protein [Alphaproteobacteria bacterium]
MPEPRKSNQRAAARQTQHINAIDRHVGAQMRRLRLERGLAPAKLGKRLGITFSQIRNYERGIDRIGPAHLFEIAKMFEVPVASFFAGLV